MPNPARRPYFVRHGREPGHALRLVICSEFEHNTRLIVAGLDELLAKLHQGAMP